MKGVHPPLNDPSSAVRAEVVEVGPQFESPGETPLHFSEGPFKEGRRIGLRLAGLVALLLVGIALMPGGQQSVLSTAADVTLPQPVIATSTIPVAPMSVAVLTDETFGLIPVPDLEGFTTFAGPAEFAGRYWIAARAATPSNKVTILTSSDGSNWLTESELVGPEPTIVPQELVVFGSNLVLIATRSDLPETPMSTGQSQQLVAWFSANGRSWSVQALPDLEGAAYHSVTVAVGNDLVMVSVGTYEAYGELREAAIPNEFHPAIAAGQLFTNWERFADQLTVKLMAPPGLEVFSTDVVVSTPRVFNDWRVLLSKDLNTWDVLDPSIAGPWGLAWSEDVGFVRRGVNGEPLVSADGQFWERSPDLPPADFRTWGSGLLGLVDTPGGMVDLLVVDDGTVTRIDLPGDVSVASGYPWIETGPRGLVAAVTRYEIQNYPPATITSGGMLLALDQDLLVITKNGQDHARIRLWSPSAKATYDPATGLIEIPPDEGLEITTIPLDDLVSLWSPIPNSARTEFYQSSDGLTWSKGEAAIFSDGVTLIGGTDSGFLIGVGANAVAGWEQDMTVLRTGPID